MPGGKMAVRANLRRLESNVKFSVFDMEPCSICALEIDQGVIVFAIFNLVFSVVCVFAYFMDLLHTSGLAQTGYTYHVTKEEDHDSYGRSVLPTSILLVILASAELITSVALVSGSCGQSYTFVSSWLLINYCLTTLRLLYFFFASIFGTSTVALIIQIIDISVITPYALWIVRKYLEFLHQDRGEHIVSPTPGPIVVPTSTNQHISIPESQYDLYLDQTYRQAVEDGTLHNLGLESETGHI